MKKRFKPSYWLKAEKFQFGLYIIGFGIIGGIVIIFSHAATSSSAIEPESGTLSGNVSLVTDATASGGSAVKFQAAASSNTGRCQHTATKVCYNNQLWYLNGVNMPWFNYSYTAGYGDFGGGTTSGVQASKADIGVRFSNFHNTGSSVVRWWMFEGGSWQINRASDGTPTSLNNAVYADIDAALQLADQYNLYYDFTLFSAVDNSGFPASWRTNPTQRQALANVLAPLFARYKDNPRIMTWELFNEPEWQIWNNLDGANATDVVALAKALVSSIRTNAPKTMTTIGEARIDGIPMWKSVDLDFDSPHWYDPMVDGYDSALLNTASGLQSANGMTRPIVLGEFPFTGTSSALNVSRLNDFYGRSYAGSWDWSLFADHTSDNIATDLPAMTNFKTQHNDIGPKQ